MLKKKDFKLKKINHTAFKLKNMFFFKSCSRDKRPVFSAPIRYVIQYYMGLLGPALEIFIWSLFEMLVYGERLPVGYRDLSNQRCL